MVTEPAVIEPTATELVSRERVLGVGIDEILASTAATLILPADVPEMAIAAA